MAELRTTTMGDDAELGIHREEQGVKRLIRSGLALIVLLGTLAHSAWAQQRPAPGAWSGTIGVATVALPSYAGSDRHRALPLPLASVEYRGRIFLGASPGGVGAGLGANLVRTPTVTWSVALSGSDRRPESRGDALAGMGDRGFGLATATSLTVRTGSFQTSAAVTRGLAEGAGWTGTVGVKATRIVANRWVVGLGSGVTVADTRQMEYDFGVNAGQARTRSLLLAAGGSGLEADEAMTHAPTGGLQSLQLSTNVAYLIDFRWTALAFLSGSRLVGDAAESPLVRDRHAIMAGAGISYRW